MKHRIIDLFAGAGGLTLGFVDHRFCGDFESVFAIDNNKHAVATYNLRFGYHCICSNIEDWLIANSKVPAAEVVVGGTPCQGFSLLNKGRNGDHRREFWKSFMDVVEMSAASVFIMENVVGLLRSPELKKIINRARDLDFHVESTILNAADFGTPQTRLRTIVIGWIPNRFSNDLIFPPPKTHSSPHQDDELQNWLNVADAIDDLPDPVGTEIRNCPPPLELHFNRNPTPISRKRYKAVPPGGNRFDLQRNAPEITPKCWIRKKSGGTDLFGRLWWDKPSVTIRTEFFKPEKGRYLHPEKHRPITHREAARLMGFPDDFRFVGTKIEVAKQIGNAVSPPLAGAIARTVSTLLNTAKQQAA